MSDRVWFLLFVVVSFGIAGCAEGLRVILPSTLNVFEMELLSLTCNATDYTEGTNLTFVWQKLSDPDFWPVYSQSLILAPISIEDGGDYECQVTTDTGLKATGTVEITVQFLPRWTLLALKKFASELNKEVVLNCSVYAYPVPFFFWINPQGMNITTSPDFVITSAGSISTLAIKSVKQTDYGNYTCVAYNVAGASRFILPLLLPGKPDSPLQCNVTEVGNTYASVQCIPGFSGGASDLSYFVMKESPGGLSAQRAKSSVRSISDGLVVIVVDDLSPGTNYTLKISTENKYGQSDDSVGVLVWTQFGGDSRPLPLAIIIGASVGGGVFVIILILLICCVMNCRNKKKDPLSNSQGKLTSDLVDKNNSGSTTTVNLQRNAINESQNSNQFNRLNNSDATNYYLNINHNPGESCDGFENAAYSGNISDEPKGGTTGKWGKLYDTNGKEQFSLAGHGALKTIGLEMSSFEKPAVGAKNCSVPIPPFQPNVQWEYPKEKLYIRNKVGEGSYSEVWQAKGYGILGKPGQKLVAVKMLRDKHTPEEKQYLCRDLEVMKLLQPHPNVVLLLGCCTKANPMCLILELATNGNLLNLLRQQRQAFSPNNFNEDQSEATCQRHVNLSMMDLVKFAMQVANGLAYISSNQLIHRDLAARNVLLDEQLVCKISDFGTVDDIVELRQYESKTRRRLPLRWMAPESLTLSEYSVQTDIWSFGILMWEIITLGSTPYPGFSGPQVMEDVQKGNHMKMPQICPDAMFVLMKSCWCFYPSKRPSFSTLQERLSQVMDRWSSQDRFYVDQMSENISEILHNQPGEKC